MSAHHCHCQDVLVNASMLVVYFSSIFHQSEIWEPIVVVPDNQQLGGDNETSDTDTQQLWTFHLFDFALLPVYLLGQGGHVHGLDLPEGGELLQPLPGLLLHGNYKGVLHVAVLRQFLRCRTKLLLFF